MKYSNAKLIQNFRLKYGKVLLLKSVFIFLIFSCGRADSVEKPIMKAPITVGAEQLSVYLPLLEGKKVGVVANQSSLIQEAHLVDALLENKISIIRVFSPEHGFRGDADAGEKVNSEVDQETGLPIVSLYGSNKKPKDEQLSGIDIMIFDIQDVGVRFYTYISTLHYVMEACAENGIPLIILDRPNPNGHIVDGPILDKQFKSFVGMHQIPILHGMTIGEYGKMINGEKWLANKVECDLTVIPCKYYNRFDKYSLPVPPSPNLRSDISIQLYPSLCLLEATTATVGRGTDGPFERYGHPNFPKTEFSFIPKSGYGSKHPKFEGKKCNGYNLNHSDYERMDRIDLSFLINAYSILGEKLFKGKESSFNLLAGNDILIQQIRDGLSEDEIIATWQKGLVDFKEKREQYLLY